MEVQNQIDQTTMSRSQEKTEINVAIIQTDIGYIKGKIEEVNKKFDVISLSYATKAEVQLIRIVVFGMVGLILVAVMGTILINLGLKIGH